MRQPYQTLIFPYKKENNEILFAIFLRDDMKVWQGIYSGGEENKTILDTAKREAFEEAGIKYNSNYIQLDTIRHNNHNTCSCNNWKILLGRRYFCSKRILLRCKCERSRNKIK